MGEPSTACASGRAPQPKGGARWLAALPFALAWTIAAATLNGALARPPAGELRLEHAPPPPSSPPATHHDELVYDSSELISV